MYASYPFHFLNHAEALYLALKEDPFYLHIQHTITHASPQEAMCAYMDFSLRMAKSYGIAYLPFETPYGASIWTLPQAEKVATAEKQLKLDFLETYLGINTLTAYRAIVAYMSAQTELLVPKDAWYLSILGVHPNFQNQGLGANLIQPILKEADKKGVASYLETFSDRNTRFYERLGYQKLSSFHEPTIDARYWVMLRRPQHPSNNSQSPPL